MIKQIQILFGVVVAGFVLLVIQGRRCCFVGSRKACETDVFCMKNVRVCKAKKSVYSLFKKRACYFLLFGMDTLLVCRTHLGLVHPCSKR